MGLPDLPEPFHYARAGTPARGQSGRSRIHISRPVPQWPDDKWPPMVTLCTAQAKGGFYLVSADRLPSLHLDDLCPRCEPKMTDETWRAAVAAIENASATTKEP